MSGAACKKKPANSEPAPAAETYENLFHDVRNLMSIHFAELQILEQELAASGFPPERVASLKKTWYAMLKLINDAADQSNMRRGALAPVYQNLDVAALLEETVHACASLAGAKDILLTFASDTRQKIMAVDKSILERIVLNLLSNSIKFTERFGRIEATLEDRGDRIAVIIRDTGIGIPGDRIERIFDRYQCDKTRMNPSGSGIGLSIVQDFVDLLGGDIRVSSGPGGTTFYVELPAFVLKEGYGGGFAQRLDGMSADMVARIELAELMG